MVTSRNDSSKHWLSCQESRRPEVGGKWIHVLNCSFKVEKEVFSCDFQRSEIRSEIELRRETDVVSASRNAQV